MSVLSVTTQMYFETFTDMIVPAALFTPPPKVDSQILRLIRRTQPYFGTRDSKQLFRLVKAGFSERRKKLRSSLSGGLQMSKDDTDGLLTKAGIDKDLRAQNLSLDEWLHLYDTYKH
jgi:16S rRNA (adenine1518-N6/adenine1519-N6)-dimethyltransferase